MTDSTAALIRSARESAEAFNSWLEARIAPAVQEAAVEGQPDVQMYPLHGVYAPAFGREEQTATL